MLSNQFNYTSISRAQIAGQRIYNCPGGFNLPSVTTILEKTKSIEDRNSLEQWKKRVGAEKAEKIKNEAACRGTRQGKFLENYINTGNMGPIGSHPISKLAHTMASTIIENGLDRCELFFGTEIGLWYNPYYAGSTDCIAQMNGEIIIVDFKQINAIRDEKYLNNYKCQLVAYAVSHNFLYGTNIRRGIDMMCTPDLQYQESEIAGAEFDKYEILWWERVIKYYDMKEKGEL
jgi:genome maintenance exonuclease 1